MHEELDIRLATKMDVIVAVKEICTMEQSRYEESF